MNDELLNKIKDSIDIPMKDMDIYVDSVIYVNDTTEPTIRIILNKVNGLDIDTLVEASKIINPIVDKINADCNNYVLEICSKERGD